MIFISKTNTMIFLDAEAAPQLGVFEKLVDYGVLGIAVLALGVIGWIFIKRLMNERDKLQDKVDELEKELRNR